MKKFFLISCIFLIHFTVFISASSNPNLSRLHGYQFSAGIEQTQSAAAIGTLDGTFGSGGILDIDSINDGGVASSIIVSPTGDFIVGVGAYEGPLVLAQYNAQGSLQSSYGTSGVVTLFETEQWSNAMIFDAQGRLLVSGGLLYDSEIYYSGGFLTRLTSSGVIDDTFNFSTESAWACITNLAMQSSGQIIAVGISVIDDSQDNPYVQVGRYNLDGSIDLDFGTDGYVVISNLENLVGGTVGGYGPYQGLVVDSDNNIYVLMQMISVDGLHSGAVNYTYLIKISENGVYDDSNCYHIDYLDYSYGCAMAIDADGYLVLAAGEKEGTLAIAVTKYDTDGNPVGGDWTNFNSYDDLNDGQYNLTTVLTSTDEAGNESIYLLGYDNNYYLVVIKLDGITGAVDTTFNGTGYNLFGVSDSEDSELMAGAIAPDGQLYAVGYEYVIDYIPYVYRFNNNQYVSQVPQFPNAQEQGILSLAFGDNATQTYEGVTALFNGSFGPLLQQQATAAIEVLQGSNFTQGDIVIGMNGVTNSSSNSNMMLSWLTASGTIDTTVNSGGTYPGFLTLANDTSSDEYLSMMVEDVSGSLYIAGSASTGGGAATLRCYTNSSTSSWTTGDDYWNVAESGSGWQGVGVSLQNNRTLLCVDEGVSGSYDSSLETGHISGYVGGVLDTTFGQNGSGQISTVVGDAFGPCYGLVVQSNDLSDNIIYAAYADSYTAAVDVAAFVANGSELVAEFAGGGFIYNLFESVGSPTPASNNVRIGLLANGNLVVAAVFNFDIIPHLYVAEISTVYSLEDPSTYGEIVESFTVTITGTTDLNISRVTGISDGTAVVTFWDSASDDTMYVARVNVGVTGLDTTFNSQGSQQGVLPIKIGDKVADYNARVANAAIIQSTAGANQGNIVMVGYESVTSSDATPMAMSVYGNPGTTEILDYEVIENNAGQLGATYNLSDISTGLGNVIFSYPASNVNNGFLLLGIDTGTDSIVARVHESDMTVDTTFGAGSTGSYTISGLTGISSISIDAENNIIVGGSSSGAGWAQLINNAGTSSTLFNMPGSIIAVNKILQQESGRYILAGATSSNGILVAFQDELVSPATTFAIDPTFNPLSVGSVSFAGSYLIGTTGLYAVAINANDTIVAAYANTVSPAKIVLTEITADGSGTVAGFNSGSTITTGVSADSSAVVQLNIDGSGNIIIGASYNHTTTHQVQIQRYDAAGGTSTAFTGTGVSGGVQTISSPVLGATGITLTDLMETTEQQTVLVGYNATGGNGQLFAARLLVDGSLDTSFNTMATSPDVAGSLTYNAESGVDINGGAIAVNGTILSIGSTNTTASLSDPIVTTISGDLNIPQVGQAPLEEPAGTLDYTIPGSTSGALPLASLPAGGAVSGVPARVYVYNDTVNSSPNGAILIASATTSHVYVTQLNQDLSLNTHFGSGTGSISIAESNVTITDMYVANGSNDTAQPIYVVGYTSGNIPWAAQIAVDGSSSTVVSPASSLTITGSIRQSTNERVLVSGYNGTSGAIVAYNSDMTAIDTSFGNNDGTGYYTTSVANPIYAMTMDNNGFIYIAYKVNNTTVAVQRLLANGTGVDSSFSATFITGTTYSVTEIRMAIDLDNNYLVVAAQDKTSTNNILQLKRFGLSTGSAAGAISTITVSGAVLNLADLFIDNDQNIYVVGYISSGTGSGDSIVARIENINSTTIALDTTYAATGSPAGIANLSVGAMTKVTGAMLDPDRRVYVVGSNGSTTGYMGRFFGDYYWTQDSQAILQGQVGTVDLTLDPNFTGGIDLSGQSGWSGLAGYVAYAIVENPMNDGTAFVAFGNGTNLMIGKVDADMDPVNEFGGNGNGLNSSVTMATINSMTIDAFGNLIVAGTHASAQKVVSFSSAGSLNATFATTVSSTVGTTVVQQKSGRYIVGSYNGTTGLLTAFQNESAISSLTLPVDQTFGPAGSNGFYLTGVNAQIDDLCIDENDYIYYVYNVAGQVYLGKLTANGSGLVDAQNSPTGFNSGNVVTTGISSASTSYPTRIAINSVGNILVGATMNDGSTVQVQFYNGSTGSSIASNQTVFTNAEEAPVLTKLIGSGTEFYGSIYDSTPQATAFAVLGTGGSAGNLDNNFGSSGLMTTNVETVTQVNSVAVQFDGKVVMVGAGNSGDPILIRGYGYPYIAGFEQAPDQVAAGILDTTLWPTSGAFELTHLTISGSPATTFNNLMLTGFSISKVYESGNGLMTFVADDGSGDTVVFQLLKDLSLNPSFNSSGTPGYVEFFENYGQTTGLFVDSDENIYITGNNSGSWAVGMNATGNRLSPNFELSINDNNTVITSIIQQSVGRIIVGGFFLSNYSSFVYGMTSSGEFDPTFGSDGQLFISEIDYAITSITVDAFDNIICLINASGNILLYKIDAYGSTITQLTGGTVISNNYGMPKIILDEYNNIIVASATLAGTYEVNNYGTDGSGTVLVTIPSTGSFETPMLSNIYATSDGKITLIGYDSSSNLIVARLISGSGTLELDTEYFNAAATSPSGPGYLVTSISPMNQFNDGIIHADDRIMIVGSDGTYPYMARVFGDDYVSYLSQGPVQGTAGTINTAFGNTNPPTGAYDLSTLGSGLLDGGQGKAIVSVVDGGYYMAIDDANSGANSILIKTVANGSLDTSYNSTGIATTYAPLGVNSLLEDGSGKLLLMGTHSTAGWIQRYTSVGVVDTTFNGTGIINLASGTQATVAVEQTLARLVVAGLNSSGKGALFAYESLSPNGTPGSVDVTFNSTVTPGTFTTGISNVIPTLIADEYDRLIFATLNAGGTVVSLYRLTPTGELDITFGSNGVVTNAIANASGPSSVRVAFDAAGNIIVASNSSTAHTFSVAAFDNGTSTTAGGNGASVYDQLDISGLTNSPSVTNLICSADGYALIVGTQSGTNNAWIARIVGSDDSGTYGTLDTAEFNPNGSVPGIFQYAGSGSTGHIYNGIAVNGDGTLGMLGYENNSGTYTPNLVSVYDDPYTSQESQSPDSKSVGTNDVTLGVSTTSTDNLGVTFFAVAGSDETNNQVARAVGLYNDNNIVVVLDGANDDSSGTSDIYLNLFDNDGILNSTFNSSGQATALDYYQNQYVNDMVTFTTTAGIHKAILAGYATDTTLSISGSVVLQYNIDDAELDSSFGGFDENPEGVAFGDGQSAFVVGQQSNGRIIVGGLTYGGVDGLLLGYTGNGKLDTSFGNDGYQSSNTGTTGIYTHAIDTENRILIAYNDGSGNVAVSRFLPDGSGLDASFGTDGSVTTNISGLQTGVNNNLKIAVNSSGSIIVAAVTGDGSTSNILTVYSYISDGSATNYTASFTAGSGFAGVTDSEFVIGRLLIDAAANIIIVMQDNYVENLVMTRLTSSLGLDHTFNGSGYISYTVTENGQQVTDALIHPDGRIIVVGSQYPD